ncbi:MAG: hypothetical protein ABIE22_03875 [archaeon]
MAKIGLRLGSKNSSINVPEAYAGDGDILLFMNGAGLEAKYIPWNNTGMIARKAYERELGEPVGLFSGASKSFREKVVGYFEGLRDIDDSSLEKLAFGLSEALNKED